MGQKLNSSFSLENLSLFWSSPSSEGTTFHQGTHARNVVIIFFQISHIHSSPSWVFLAFSASPSPASVTSLSKKTSCFHLISPLTHVPAFTPLIHSSHNQMRSKSDHVTSLLNTLHWPPIALRIKGKPCPSLHLLS